MSALAKIEAQGFAMALHTDGLYIEPVDALTPAQRQWVIEHKAQVRAELHVRRWQWFLSLAADHGIYPDVVAAEFPTEQDKLDVIEPATHTDDVLRACMGTLCQCIAVKNRQADYESGRWVGVEYEQ